MAEMHLPIPAEGRAAEERKPATSEAVAAPQPGPWFEARWQDPQTGTWQGEPYDRFCDARARARAEITRGAQAALVVHIPTGEVIEGIQRAPEAPGARLRGRPPVPPR